MHDHRRGFESYRTLLNYVSDWGLLFELAERIYRDRRLSWTEKDRLFTVLDDRERAMGGPAVRVLETGSPKRVVANT